MPPILSKRCQFCRKAFPTQRAVNQHISASNPCLKEWHQIIDNPHKRRRTISPEPYLVHDNYFIPPPEPRQEPRQGTPDVIDQSTPKRYIEPFPGPAGEALRPEKTRFEILQRTQQLAGKPPWEPFADRAEWGLAEWLMKNVGQKSTDEYLQLPIVS
jgi:hypothetical protein